MHALLDASPRRRNRRAALTVTSALAALAGAGPALAQSAAPGATALEGVVVTAPRGLVEQRLASLPGGASLVRIAPASDTANLTLSRALGGAPGVIVQDFFGGPDQPRLQIRGSGLQQNPVERGVLMLQDGLPLNRADGSYVVGLAGPREAEVVEVYRGHLANRIGASVMGGALNFISPTGRSLEHGDLDVSGGSFGQFGARARLATQAENWDALASAELSQRDGYRDYNHSRRASLGGSVGFQPRDGVALRLFAQHVELGFDVAGPLTKTLLRNDPTAAFTGPTVTPAGAINPGPNVVRDRPRRDTDQDRIGFRGDLAQGAHTLSAAAGYTWTDDTFRFPIAGGVRTTVGGDVNGTLRYAYKPDAAALLPLFELTTLLSKGTATRRHAQNLSGSTGAVFGDNRLDSRTSSATASLNLPLGQALTLSPSLSYASAMRGNVDRFRTSVRRTAAYSPASPTTALPAGAAAAQDTSYHRTYEAWSPSLGLSWRPAKDQFVFAAVSRSFEPPTHDDLLATINGTPNSSPGRPNPASPAATAVAFVAPALKAARGTTVEVGWRGGGERLHWDLVLYQAWIDDELLSLRDQSGVSLGAFNAGKTRHRGLEAGVSMCVTDQLDARVAYHDQDFHFHDDPVRGDNRLAGAPPRLAVVSLDYRLAPRWTVGTVVRWSLAKTPIDNLNTLYNPAYAVADLRVSHQVTPRLKVFGEVTNLTDTNYASSTLVVDTARADQAAFLPGDGRGFFTGLALSF